MDTDARRTGLATIEVLDALLLALDRRIEVAELIASSENVEDAQDRLRDQLGISEFCAAEVLNIQWRRMTRTGREQLRAHREQLVDLWAS